MCQSDLTELLAELSEFGAELRPFVVQMALQTENNIFESILLFIADTDRDKSYFGITSVVASTDAAGLCRLPSIQKTLRARRKLVLREIVAIDCVK